VLQITSYFRRYGSPYAWWYLGGTLLIAATNALSVTIPLYLAQGIDALREGARDQVFEASVYVAVMGGLVILVRWLSRLAFFTPGRLVEAQIKRDLFASILRQQSEFHARYPSGDLMNRMTSDVQMVRLMFGFTLLGIVNTVLAMGLTASQMVRLSPSLAATVTVPLVLGFAITLGFVGRFRKIQIRMQEATSALSDFVLSSYQGVATLKAFGAERAIQERFTPLNREALEAQLQRARLRVGIGPVLSLAASFNIFLLLWIGGPMPSQGVLTVGELVAFITLVTYLTGPLRGMTFILSLFRQAQAAMERLDAVLMQRPLRPDLPNPVDAPALKNISVAVRGGGTLGVFGPTGSGKSTLLRCLTRLNDPPPRAVYVGDLDVRSIHLEAWRERAVLVPQRAFLFSETVSDNVLLGIDPRLLTPLLKRAQLQVDMEALPKGVLTEVGEAGLTLSGGQRQRVALARGLSRNATVLLLDDVLSAVDHATEATLIAELQSNPDRPTTVIVANRLSALRHADVIVVLDKGRMVATGTHDELIEGDSPYREAWLRQSDPELAETA